MGSTTVSWLLSPETRKPIFTKIKYDKASTATAVAGAVSCSFRPVV
jgi:hypothetical protein